MNAHKRTRLHKQKSSITKDVNITGIEENGVCRERSSHSGKKPKISAIKSAPPEDEVLCETCGIHIPLKRKYAHYRTNAHKQKSCVASDVSNVMLIKSAFKNRVASYRLTSDAESFTNIEDFMIRAREKAVKLFRDRLCDLCALKANVELFASYVVESNGKLISSIKSFNTKNEIITKSSDLHALFDAWVAVIKHKTESFQERDSGWALEKVLFLEINVNQYKPLRG